ncbi:MAG: mechanosensitive ion channel domain-containing protein, partial [Candidatus Heimdallarchaeota archaeon]
MMQELISQDVERFAKLILAIIIIFIGEKVIQWILSNKIKNMLEIAVDDVINGIKVIVRLGAVIAILYAAMFIYDLSIESILGLSALLGAIVTFSSVQAIQNFIAGLFILVSRPFGIEDLVYISGKEGVVTEISLNYTRLKTFDESYIYIPNKNILNAVIINYNRKIKKKKDKNTKLSNLRTMSSFFDED